MSQPLTTLAPKTFLQCCSFFFFQNQGLCASQQKYICSWSQLILHLVHRVMYRPIVKYMMLYRYHTMGLWEVFLNINHWDPTTILLIGVVKGCISTILKVQGGVKWPTQFFRGGGQNGDKKIKLSFWRGISFKCKVPMYLLVYRELPIKLVIIQKKIGQ